MSTQTVFSADLLKLDVAGAVDRITAAIREQVLKDLRRKGAVLGLSGGIDSSVVAALCARALGQDRVLALLMPERESSGDSLSLGRFVADHLGIATILEDITPLLEVAGCYRRRDEMIRKVIPEYGPDYKCKIVLPGLLDGESYRIFSVVAQAPDGRQSKARLTPQAYHGVVAATNFKQRVRKMMEYYHADRLNYAVLGTPNRQEYDQGFFVKNGVLGGPEAHCPPVQDPGVSVGGISRHPRGYPQPPSDHGHVLDEPVPGRVLFFPSVRQNGSLSLRQESRSACRRRCPRGWPDGRASGRGVS